MILLVALLFFVSLSAHAQTPPPQDLNGIITGMVQYVEGTPSWSSEKTSRPDIQFQSLIYRRDKINLGRNEILKFVSEKLCQGVIYGPATIKTPESSADQWTLLNARGVRWICPKEKSQSIIIDRTEARVSGGELVYQNGQLLVRQDLVQSDRQPLTTGTLYKKNGATWTAVTPQPEEYEKWQFNNDLRIPSESAEFTRPNRLFNHRLILSASPIGGGGLKHDEEQLDNDDLSAEQIYLQYQKRWGNRSLTFGAGRFETFLEGENRSNNSNSRFEPQTEFEMTFFDLGIRWNHEKTWAFYTRAGLGFGSVQSNGDFIVDATNGTFQGFNSEADHTFAIFTFGVEKTFFRNNVERWGLLNLLGLYTSVELKLIQSIATTNTRFEDFGGAGSTGNLPEEIENGQIFSAALLFNIGLPFGLW